MGRGNFAAQGLEFGKFGSSDYDDWMDVFRINTFAPMKMAEAFVQHVAASEQKKIVALTSIIGSIAKNQIGSLYSYRASKAALNAIMRSMAIDLGGSTRSSRPRSTRAGCAPRWAGRVRISMRRRASPACAR